MANPARVFARVMDWADPAGTPTDGEEKVRIEWARLDGSRDKGKSIFVLQLVSKHRLASDLVDSLVDELNDKFPSEDFRNGDVILWGA